MKIKIEFEVPNWTRWAIGGLAVGIIVGYATASVRAAAVSVATVWKNGDTLTAEALNQNFKLLQDALNAQQATLDAIEDPDCPKGYMRDATSAVAIVCTKSNDQIVKVDSGRMAFWIDRYEASIWDQSSGSGNQFGVSDAGPDYPASFPTNGQYSVPHFAVSRVNVRPASWASWFQAAAACQASGKRLPTADEWQRAVRGTIDPGTSNGNAGSCYTNGTTIRSTGLGAACVSYWGAEDMLGNLWEFIAEWSAQVAAGYPQTAWPGSDFHSDVAYGIGGTGLPSVLSRGGSLFDSDAAGTFAIDLRYSPIEQRLTHGFRCATPR